MIDVPVQRGRAMPRPDMPDALEILSGLQRRRRAGAAVNLGLSGRLTQATIRSPLTPLFLLAALAVGLIALLTIPREEEPQISVPMVDIRVNADGLKAPDAVELVTKPLEDHRQGHRRRRARLQPDGRRPRDGDRALPRRHQRRRRHPARAREDPRQSRPHPGRHSRAADRRPRHQRRRRRGADAVAEAGGGVALDRQGSLRARGAAAVRADEDRQCRPDLHFRRQSAADPGRARSGEARALRRHAAAARRQGARCQPLVPGRPGARHRHHAHGRRRADAGRHSRHRPAAGDDARQPAGLCARRRHGRDRPEPAGAPRLDGNAGAGRPLGPRAGGQRRLRQARRRQCRRGGGGVAGAAADASKAGWSRTTSM